MEMFYKQTRGKAKVPIGRRREEGLEKGETYKMAEQVQDRLKWRDIVGKHKTVQTVQKEEKKMKKKEKEEEEKKELEEKEKKEKKKEEEKEENKKKKEEEKKKKKYSSTLCSWFRAIFNNCPTRCNTKQSVY